MIKAAQRIEEEMRALEAPPERPPAARARTAG